MNMHHMIHYMNPCVCAFYSSMTAPAHPLGWILCPENRGRSCSGRNIYRVWQHHFSHGHQMRPNSSALNYEEEQRPELMMEDKRQACKRLSNRYF